MDNFCMLVNEYFLRIKNQQNISHLFTKNAIVHSYKFGKISIFDYQSLLLNQETVSIDYKILFIHQLPSLLICHIDFIFDSKIKRQYIDVFEFNNEKKIQRLYLNRILDNSNFLD